MKNRKIAFISAMLAVLGGAGLILGNQILVSNVLASGTRTEPAIVTSENETGALQLSNVGMYNNKEGEPYMALKDDALTLKNVSTSLEITDLTLTDAGSGIQVEKVHPTIIAEESDATPDNPTDGKLSEEKAKRIGIGAVAQEYGLTQKELESFDVTVMGRYARRGASEVPNILIWSVKLTPVNPEDYPTIECYVATFEDLLEEAVSVHYVPVYKEGTPSADELSSDKAKEIGIAAITKKYATTQETLGRFTITTKYYEIAPETPGRHTWWVNLYPTNVDEFSEIGCYWTYIDAETGEVLQLNSAVDGKG